MENETTTKEIIELVDQHRSILSEHTRVTEGHWRAMIRRMENFRISTSGEKVGCHDEEIWTFLTSVAFSSGGQSGNSDLFKALTESTEPNVESRQWLESLPLPPRNGEGNTNLDLAMGSIQPRGITSNGIEYDGSKRPIVFCEMKWFSDLSYGVTGDPHRNQLIRVIENAVTFQSSEGHPDIVHVTLVTPREFKNRKQASRFYHTKFYEYADPETGADMMLSELRSCRLNVYTNQGWRYPETTDLEKRIRNLSLHWVTFEDLISMTPTTEMGKLVRDFESAYNHSGG